jgi:hypothetical protein
MFDVLAVLVFVLLVPTALVGLLVLPLWWLLKVTTHRAPSLQHPLRALASALLLQIVFLILGGFVIAILFGKALGYAGPALIFLLTLAVGLVGFIYFLFKEAPPAFQPRAWSLWVKSLFKSSWS